MKSTVLKTIFFFAAIFAFETSFAQSCCADKLASCPKKGQPDCPIVKACPTDQTTASQQMANCPKKGTADCPLIKSCPKKGTADCPFDAANDKQYPLQNLKRQPAAAQKNNLQTKT